MYKKINVRKIFKIFVRTGTIIFSICTNQFFVRPSEFEPTYRLYRTTFTQFDRSTKDLTLLFMSQVYRLYP
jgi:hypothetical protein